MCIPYDNLTTTNNPAIVEGIVPYWDNLTSRQFHYGERERERETLGWLYIHVTKLTELVKASCP